MQLARRKIENIGTTQWPLATSPRRHLARTI